MGQWYCCPTIVHLERQIIGTLAYTQYVQKYVDTWLLHLWAFWTSNAQNKGINRDLAPVAAKQPPLHPSSMGVVETLCNLEGCLHTFGHLVYLLVVHYLVEMACVMFMGSKAIQNWSSCHTPCPTVRAVAKEQILRTQNVEKFTQSEVIC